MIEIVVNRETLQASVNLVGEAGSVVGAAEGSMILKQRSPRSDLEQDPALPDDTRIWAGLQDVSGGTWGGAVYDVNAILRVITAGRRALAQDMSSVESSKLLEASQA